MCHDSNSSKITKTHSLNIFGEVFPNEFNISLNKLEVYSIIKLQYQ